MSKSSVKILGYGVDGYDFEQALEYAQDNGGQVVTINPEMILAAQKSTEFSQIINDAELVIPDGIGVQIGLQILGHKVKRIPGIEFGYSLLEKYSIAGKRVALVGAKPEVIALAVKNLKDKMPNLNIVYSHDGYFSDDNEISVSTVLLPNFQKLTDEELVNAPKLRLSQDSVVLTDIKNKKGKCIIEISNVGRSTLEIRSLQMFTVGLEVSLKDTKLAPGESTKMKITVLTKALKKARTKPRILMITNDPDHGKVMIPVIVK